jgi:hypothetical protein
LDFNYLFHRQQVSLMRAEAATCVPARQAHVELARMYERLIDFGRSQRGGIRFNAAPLG